eukprot:SAG11_NODE_3534_length_2386_cov_3.060778_6_plen_50_part_00
MRPGKVRHDPDGSTETYWAGVHSVSTADVRRVVFYDGVVRRAMRHFGVL